MSGASRTTGSSRRRAIVSSIGALAVALSTTIAMSGPAAAAPGYDATSDVNSMYNTTLYTGVRNWWKAGYTGDGVDVAVIDTGVTPVDGLADPGKIVYGPDLSLDAPADNLHNLDANGHGTFMAGIIAGRGSGADPGSYAGDQTNFLGVAPDARIVSVKVGASDGSVDVSQVIAAIDWVVQHRNDNGLNIRVLNLSYGTDSAQPYQVDPLAYAVEQAWKAGIFVVAATGNAGYQFKTGTLADPAYDPKIFAVGATDAQGTMSTVGRHRRVLLIDGEQRALRRRRQPRVAPREPARPGVVHRSDLRELRLRERRAVPWERHERGRRLHVR